VRPARAATTATWGLDSGKGEHWDSRAACANPDYDPVWWDVPAPTDAVDRRTTVDRALGALNICAGCPVKMACDEDAQRHRTVAQIRGGKIYGHAGEVRDPEWLGIQRTPMGSRKPEVKLKPYADEILAMRDSGLSYEAIAERYGSSKDSIKSFITHARRRRALRAVA
jgi:hypothetical protein